MSRLVSSATALVIPLLLAGCGDDLGTTPTDPDTAPRAMVDRFSAAAGHLMVRDGNNGLPPPGAPIAFDQAPFITTGLSPAGQPTRYYNFDVQPIAPAPIYVVARNGRPIDGQLNIVDVVPGDPGYNDFWQVVMVEAPAEYVANTITSVDEIISAGLVMTATETLVNCPIVPEGSTAALRFGGAAAELHRGWYRDELVTYFSFEEKALSGATVPTSPIYVTFNINPGQDGGGPPSGFVTEPGTARTHNVVATTPANAGYSPLWSVQIYDNAAFAAVNNLATAEQAAVLVANAATVNCPTVE